ncbi:MAG TPA: DUF4296 domain-containing protein [Chitinophagaceae bacterium]|nr:DUF4296 domain-containing protein [Chitinophagaceae bacterium]
MKCLLGIVLAMIVTFSCSEKKNRSDVLPEKKMREVMWDMIRADQYVSDFVLRDSTKKKKEESVNLYEQIFNLHKITREQFKKSLEYYSSRPDLFRPIVDSLAVRKNELPPHPTRPIISDSALKVKQSFQHKFLPKQ